MMTRWLTMGVLMGFLALPVAAQQTKFPTTTELAGKRLVLNGAGTRYRTVIKVYDLALYVPQKANNREALLAQKGPYRVRLVALRDIDAGDIGRAMVVGMRDNLPADEAYRLTRYSKLMIDLFSTQPRIFAGSVFGVDWVPGKGASFYLDGKKLNELADPAFIEPFLSIWLGQVPADHRLKDQLLGTAVPQMAN